MALYELALKVTYFLLVETVTKSPPANQGWGYRPPASEGGVSKPHYKKSMWLKDIFVGILRKFTNTEDIYIYNL